MKVGFIGVGSIGNPMAGQLLRAGHELLMHDIRRETAASLLARGAAWLDSPAAVAAASEIVATCLPGPKEMEQVVLGPKGILEGVRKGSLYVDHTTNSPLLVRRVHDLLAARGVDMLDAPVSGGTEGAQTRDLLVMVGGEGRVFERARPVLDALAARVIHVGAIGCGSVCKIMHNCASFTLDLTMAECWTVGVKAGVAPETIVDVFKNAALGRARNGKWLQSGISTSSASASPARVRSATSGKSDSLRPPRTISTGLRIFPSTSHCAGKSVSRESRRWSSRSRSPKRQVKRPPGAGAKCSRMTMARPAAGIFA